MSWRDPPEFPDPGDGREDEPFDDGWEDVEGRRWPLGWRGLYPRERWMWFEQLWTDVCALRERYRLPVRSGWWEDELQVEALAAFAAWTERYDSGEWDDPPGKLGLLHDIERVAGLLRDGNEPFHPGPRPAGVRASPDRDRLPAPAKPGRERVIDTDPELYLLGVTHRIGAKGQVVIPKELRERADLHPGTEVEFELDGDRVVLARRIDRSRLGGRFRGSGMAANLLADRAREVR